MRQVLCSSTGALVARMPRPVAGPGQVLVRVEYSLISVGTEIAPMRSLSADPQSSRIEQATAYASLARRYLSKAIRDPQKAARRVKSIVRREIRRFRPPPGSPETAQPVGDLGWERAEATALRAEGAALTLTTDTSDCGYQALTAPIALGEGRWPAVELSGAVTRGAIQVGLLDATRQNWLGMHRFDEGRIDDRIVFDPRGSTEVTVVITTAGEPESSELSLDEIAVQLVPATDAGISQNEMGDQGWMVGYSAAGTVVSVGEGVNDLSIGDAVACGGAAYAHHADYVAVPRNLVCPVPKGVDLRSAATTTVGTIALQGVRRAEPELGDVVCVVGLGLIGQITAQLLRANGCTVVGLDLDSERVERARGLGLVHGTADPKALAALVRDVTGGHGADATIITAATRSSRVVNQAMELTRRRGKVVIVGDVGLDVERGEFYKKEIDLRMSTSYGPGRYDATYEEGGRDYPYAYVRWTLNRNMRSYLGLIAEGRVEIEPLIDRVVSVADAPEAYKELARGGEAQPLGVLFRYPEETGLPESADATAIRLRGHKQVPQDGPVHYALVGAGAFGTCMLVPQMERRRDRFFLRAVVSRDPGKGGNFAREHRLEKLCTRIEDVLSDPELGLVVIATRHQEHAEQVVKSLRAGKHVFVEKPLALTWDELAAVETTYGELPEPPLLMVGFNRRFSPALVKLGEVLADRRSPLIVQYRLNGGSIPLDHWIQTEVGGGRNIGEACHMYDVFRSLAGAPVRSIEATSIDPGTLPYARTDNFVATLGYEDGSVGTLTYTALGPKKGLPKERIEVFCDGEAYLIDDFRKLFRTSDGAVLWQSGDADKGHATELSLLGDAIAAGEPGPIPFEEIIETSAVALRIEDLLTGHGGDGAD